MKNTIFLAIASIALSASVTSVNAQSTVDSIAAKYTLLPMPEPTTVNKIFPVIGSFQLSGDDTRTINISLDETSKGIIWVDGLAQGRFKAYLKKSPATYRILSQKTEAGVQIQEGTLIFDKESNTLNIALGSGFNDAEPAAVFASVSAGATETPAPVKKSKTAKTKKQKVIYYTAVKTEESAITPGTAGIE